MAKVRPLIHIVGRGEMMGFVAWKGNQTNPNRKTIQRLLLSPTSLGLFVSSFLALCLVKRCFPKQKGYISYINVVNVHWL